MSAVKKMYGLDAKTADFEYTKVEDQQEVWQEASRVGRLIDERIRG
jgi:hypothetical protein